MIDALRELGWCALCAIPFVLTGWALLRRKSKDDEDDLDF